MRREYIFGKDSADRADSYYFSLVKFGAIGILLGGLYFSEVYENGCAQTNRSIVKSIENAVDRFDPPSSWATP